MDVRIKSAVCAEELYSLPRVPAKQRQRRKKLDEEREMPGGRVQGNSCIYNQLASKETCEPEGKTSAEKCLERNMPIMAQTRVPFEREKRKAQGKGNTFVEQDRGYCSPDGNCGWKSVQQTPCKRFDQGSLTEFRAGGTGQSRWTEVCADGIPSKEAYEPNSVQAIRVKSSGHNSVHIGLWTGSAGRNPLQVSHWTGFAQIVWTGFRSEKSLDRFPCT
ncbi:hypothetical protein C8R47DRAFT_1082053 [Mycena vitilis]|nr:hypothetical protein C8R47DRAFT_1082053 [Mycena vitilis]